MNPKTKKGLIVVASLLAVGGIGYYFYKKSTKSEDKTKTDTTTPPDDSGNTTTTTTKPRPDDSGKHPSVPAPVKTTSPSIGVKIYAVKTGTPIWSKIGDVVPYRLAGNSELLGTRGNLKKDYFGDSYWEVVNGKDIKYVSILNVKTTK